MSIGGRALRSRGDSILRKSLVGISYFKKSERIMGYQVLKQKWYIMRTITRIRAKTVTKKVLAVSAAFIEGVKRT